MPDNVHVIEHPLVQHKLTLMRRKETSTANFRKLLNEIGALLAYEVTRNFPMHEVEVETPLEKTTGRMIDGKKLVFVPILRAGTGLLDGFLSVIPGARVGHLGLYRDPKTLTPGRVLLQDARRDAGARRDRARSDARHRQLGDRRRGPAEAGAAALDPAGVPGRLTRGHGDTSPRAHPDVAVYTAAIDRQLNDHGYILPGLGDAGDRIFGTK